MIEINWIVATFFLILIFAISGYFQGWWKEAIITIFLTFLVFLLQLPNIAQGLINLINGLIVILWGLLSETYQLIFGSFLETNLDIETNGGPPLLDPGSWQTWVFILLIILGIAVLVSRLSLPNTGRLGTPYYGYLATFGGGLTGAVLGGFNGWLIASLLAAYFDGSKLPGAPARLGGSVTVQAVSVPATSILDSILPWLFVVLGILLLFVATRSRVVVVRDKEGFRSIDYRTPLGYRRVDPTVSEG